ncbi:MAG: DivIVA domain-containing protein [Slackia sp.]|nr:DivIVA domain-containing protein [Slackia sp.]
MAITSEEIHNQSFTVDRKGYDVDEVDVFLEHVAAEIDGLNAEIDELTARLNDLQNGTSYVDDEPMDMDAAFAEPALPEQADDAEEPASELSSDEKDARIAELERLLSEKENDASAIANALVVAQRSAKEVVDAANGEAKRIKADAEADAADIIDRANAEKARIEDAIDELDRSHKETCEVYAEALRAFIEDANGKLDDIEEELVKKDGKKRAHARFAGPSQAPVHKPMPAGATGAIAPSYTAPAAAAPATPVTIPVTPKPSTVEKDLSGYGDASDAFDLGDID